MSRSRVYIGIVLLTTLSVMVPIILGNSSGAITGVSGGPAGQAANCTACHPFNMGVGQVEILGAPLRYRAGEIYDITVRVTDPPLDGTGFEVSAEGAGFHQGTLITTDLVNTQFASPNPDYITHTLAGLTDSRADWDANGGSYDYNFQWQAPMGDAGPITFFGAANVVDDLAYFVGVHYYATHATTHFSIPGDGDGDTDVDLDDHMELVACMGTLRSSTVGTCNSVDFNSDNKVDLADAAIMQNAFTGATSSLPPDYVIADPVRGGLLYDKWWLENGAPEPVGDHPLYPLIGTQSGAATHRCKECHGWDYKGRDGAYGMGSTHFTDIFGVQGTTLTPQGLFDLLKADPMVVTDGHDMDSFGMTDRDIWDVVKMTLEGVVETDDFILPTCNGGTNAGVTCMVDGDCGGGTCDGASVFLGVSFNGQNTFDNLCANCHGFDGRGIDFGGGEFIGTVASVNPWEFLHKVRFGHPASPMPSFVLLGWSDQMAADVGVYAATLPAARLAEPASATSRVTSTKFIRSRTQR